MTSKSAPPQTRMRSEDRRESILDAATDVFGDYGYVGTTTDQVAKAAGVSQPYVVRMFGTKQKLFLEVLQRALDKLLSTFRAVLAEPDEAGDLHHRLGIAYAQLSAREPGLLLSLMHAFVLGKEPEIGRAARDGFLEVYDLLRTEGGFSAEDATQFLAYGMLMNTLVGIRMSDSFGESETAKELMTAAFPLKLDIILGGRER